MPWCFFDGTFFTGRKKNNCYNILSKYFQSCNNGFNIYQSHSKREQFFFKKMPLQSISLLLQLYKWHIQTCEGVEHGINKMGNFIENVKFSPMQHHFITDRNPIRIPTS